MSENRSYSRRQFLRVASLGTAATILAACGGAATPAPAPAQRPTPRPTPTPVPETASGASAAASGVEAASEEEAAAAAEVLVKDVVDYSLTSGEWEGAFGFVTFNLHEAFFNGDMAYHIRTDASDPDFAKEQGLLHVPLLNAIIPNEDLSAPYYVFESGVDEQRPVLSTIPAMDDFTPALRVHQVSFSGSPTLLDSVEAIEAAEQDGDISIEKLNLVVNYPLVKWPEGELTTDEARQEYLGTGQLLGTPDTDNLQVTFKLHQCYPGSRYIVTDTSAVPMAPMMSISPSPKTAGLAEARAVDKIWVFGNGIPGSGVMGFQPAIFGNQATNPAWSPFWDHFTLVWADEEAARILSSKEDVDAALSANEVSLFNGTPDSHPTGFVVNCPVPVIAPNTFTG